MKEMQYYNKLLGYYREKSMRFSQFIDAFVADPVPSLHTSSTLIHAAIKHFGYRIVIRSGEPTISYRIFEDPFSGGINAVFGQEFSISQLVDLIESIGKESGPNRGIVLVGPPASGKTNIADLISMAIEVYSKEEDAKLYSFYYEFTDEHGRILEVRSSFMHNPILLFPVILKLDGQITHPRQELFDYINSRRGANDKILCPTYYQNATLDKLNLDILKTLLENPRNSGKSLFDIIEEYVRVEKIEFSSAQARGIANIDDMKNLEIKVRSMDLGQEYRAILNSHLPGYSLYQYEGAIVNANRGLLHIHDAFGNNEGNAPKEIEYKPLLMLLGSGKSSIESTQTSVDTTVLLTTNIDEMKVLDKQITSSKFLDRIDKIPVNYLLDANSEMDILKRDILNMREKYDIDPNLIKIAAFYAVMTRLLPPVKTQLPESWSKEKKDLYLSIAPEKKMFIYAAQPEDPVSTILKLPYWHPFYNEATKLGIDIYKPFSYEQLFVRRTDGIFLDKTGIFSQEELKLIDDEFMRELWNEYNVNEGLHGISVRQLQNVMRNTITKSDGKRINVGTFFSQLRRIFREGPILHNWIEIDPKYKERRKPIPERSIGKFVLSEGEGDYGDFEGLAKVAQYLYYYIIGREITIATVDRDPEEIEKDLRKYIQHALLANAIENRAFSHILIPRFTYIDPSTGDKIDKPDIEFLRSLEKVFIPDGDALNFRRDIAQRFLDLSAIDEIRLEPGKTIINSRRDNLIASFARDYSSLLTHRRSIEGISVEQMRDAFFQKKNAPEKYDSYNREVKELAESIISNMVKRFSYSDEIALGTIVYALRKNAIDFSTILY
jgi:predicted Ser/Thr protein kinase